MYPITNCLYAILGASSHYSARRILAGKLGNKNNSKAFSRADRMLTQPNLNDAQLKTLYRLFPEHAKSIEQSILETREQLNEEYRQAYFNSTGPHIFVCTNGPVTNALFACLAHSAWRIIKFTDAINQLPLNEQINAVKAEISKYREERGEKLPIFGAVIGFSFRPDIAAAYDFDAEGNFLGKSDTAFYAPSGSITFGARTCHLNEMSNWLMPH
jgi:hypothetical protein